MSDPNANDFTTDEYYGEIRLLTHEEYVALKASIQKGREQDKSSSGSEQECSQSTGTSSRTKPVPLPHSAARGKLAAAYARFGKAVIFLPIPGGKKEPILARWKQFSYERSQTEEHQELLLNAWEQGNVGVLLGPKSGRLFTVNNNDQEAVEEALRAFPWLTDTMRSWAKRGCQFWLILEEGDYPKVDIIVLKRNGKVIGELRLGGDKGAQSVIHGVHESKVCYQHNGKAPKEVGLSDLYDLINWGTETPAARRAIEQTLFPPIVTELDANDLLLCLDAEEPLPPFPMETLPKIFRVPVEEVMRHYRVPALIPVTCALVINSAAVGRGVAVKSNVRRTYANLYAIIGAKSGTGKTVVFDEFMVPFEELQREMLDAFKTGEKPSAEAELKLVEADVQRLLKFKRNQKEPDLAEDSRRERLGELLQRQAELEDKLETAARLWCVDFTSEALGVLLANSNEQIAVLTDEGGLALYNMIGRYTKGVVTDDILLCKAKSVNGTTVDRLGRDPIILRQPCVALLLLVQPDLLNMAFGNERLLVGGFLARCLAADSRMKILYEDETTLPEVDPAVMEGWKQHIRALVKNFRLAEEPYWINVEEGVRALSRKFHNDIVDQIRGGLWDLDAFALHWVERTWEIALNLHIGLHGAECYRHVLSNDTFAKAILISRYFANRQLEVLNAMRIKATNDRRDQLAKILEGNNKKPITFRDLKRRHGLDRQEVLNTVKSHPELFGIAELRRQSGGTPSLVVFLRLNPPPKMEAKQV